MSIISHIAGLFLNRAHETRDRHLLRLPARATNPYMTHIPILMAVAQWYRIESVLELGCGDFSTRAFLDKRFFPDLKRLHSFENDVAWAGRIYDRFGFDERLSLRLVDGAISEAAKCVDLVDYDLVFIDDSKANERSATIRAVAFCKPRKPIFVIHDFELLCIRRASKCFQHRYRFVGLNPNTGVLSNERLVPHKAEMRRLDKGLRDIGEKMSLEEWAELIPNLTCPR